MIQDGAPDTVEIPLAVCFDMHLDVGDEYEDEHPEHMWGSIGGMRSRLGPHHFPATPLSSKEASPTTHPECVFVVEVVEFDASLREMTFRLQDVLTDMAATGEGLVLSNLGVNLTPGDNFSYSCDSVAEGVGSLLESLLCKPDSPARSKLKSLKLSGGPWTEAQLSRLCTAIAVTPSAKHISIALNMSYADQKTHTIMWEMIAFALFSRHSCSSLTSVTLSRVHIRREDVDAMELVADTEDPTWMLFSGWGGNKKASAERERERTSTPPHTVTLPKGTKLALMRMEPNETYEDLSSWSLTEDISRVTLMNDDGKSAYVDVLMPAYGVCEVPRDQILQGTASCCDAPRTEVTSLTLQFGRGDPALHEDLLGLMMLVGFPLTYLGIQAIRPDGAVLQVGELLDWCRNLETLDIRDFTVATEPFITAYRDFKLIISKVQCDFDDVPLLVRELADPSSPLARNLRHLSLGVHSTYSRQSLPFEHSAAIAEMLEFNATLECLEVADPDGMQSAAASLKRFHNTVAVHPLPLSCKLAFISVFCGATPHARDPGSKRQRAASSSAADAIGRFPDILNRHILSGIFEFAATRARQRVYIRKS